MIRFSIFVLFASLQQAASIGDEPQNATASATANATPSKAALSQAIETIATSDDQGEVSAADRLLRHGGLASIKALLDHLHDLRRPLSNYLTRAVSGDVNIGDHAFWLIQDILEDHESKLDASYSPLRKDSIQRWFAKRSEMSLHELRREACIGAFAVILKKANDYPSFDPAPVLARYAKRLTVLDRRVHDGG